MIPFFKSLLWDTSAANQAWRSMFNCIGAILISGGAPALVPYKEYGVLCFALAGVIAVGEKNETTKKED
jgi:hypothetical protein